MTDRESEDSGLGLHWGCKGWVASGVNHSSRAQQGTAEQVCLLSPGPDYLMITTSSEVDFLLCFPSFLYKGMI